MNGKYFSIGAIFLAILFFTASAGAHCQLPCGIYDDDGRFGEISESITTIEKSVSEIEKLQQEKNINYNQLVRWIDNKDEHATHIQEIASQYFLAQRIKFDDDQYDKKLAALHRIIVFAMKCKQTVDTKMVDDLRNSFLTFQDLYKGGKK